MAPRANWKGFLKIAEVTCPVALYSATSSSDRIAFHTLNRATGNRVHRMFIDQETGKPVEKDDQVKGYEVASGEYVMLEPDEVSDAVPFNDKTLAVETFISCHEIDDVYFDKPYYLCPADRNAMEAYGLIRDGLREKKVVALAQTILFRRVRTVLVRAHGDGLIATTLNFDYQVRSAKEAFSELPHLSIKGEMLEFAEHIIKNKKGSFDPSQFDDRYEEALAKLVKAKLEGKKIEPREEPKRDKSVDLMAALRESAGLQDNKTPPEKTESKSKRRSKPKAASASKPAAEKTRKAG